MQDKKSRAFDRAKNQGSLYRASKALQKMETLGQFFRSIHRGKKKSVPEQRLEIKIQPRSDLLLIAIKAKSLAIIVVAFPIVSRLLLSEGFSLSEEGRIEKGRDVQNRR